MAAKSVAVTKWRDAANELAKDQSKEINKCALCFDDKWQRRGHSSLNGCVTKLPVESENCVDVEVLSRVCYGCHRMK